MQQQFDVHPGPLKKGDLIVIEIGGRVVPKLPTDSRPAVFVVLEDQRDAESVRLKPHNAPLTALHKPRLYVCAAFRF